MNLKGKVALITGGGTGIGAAVAKRFVADGARICITGRREGCLDEVIASLPTGAATKCPGDVTKPEDTERMVKTVLSFGEKIDVLVNCAGLGGMGSITDIDPVDWRKTFEVNLNGPFLLMRAVIPHMIKAGGGSIINISSLAGLRCQPKATAYSASKAALNMLTQQVAFDYGRYNIRCNAVCPGFVYTDMVEKGGLGKLAERIGVDMFSLVNNVFKDIPIRKPGTPEQIAGICSFLAGDDSSYMTGAVIPVDGGTAIVDVFPTGVKRAILELQR
ncbi:MAG TPA: SDR family oxidoreductase [Firmicutes bacterium]|nr:SDR family oxidoreductase [Bacillota bacterium]